MLVLLGVIGGAVLHGTIDIFWGFSCAIGLVVLVVFGLRWHVLTGEVVLLDNFH